MPTFDDQFIPDDDLLNEFLHGMLYPKIQELELEGLQITPIEVVVVAQDSEKTFIAINGNKSVCKVVFYKTFKPNRCVLKSSVRLLEKAIDSGFSGFNVRGDIESGVSKLKSYTLVYNVLEFGGF